MTKYRPRVWCAHCHKQPSHTFGADLFAVARTKHPGSFFGDLRCEYCKERFRVAWRALRRAEAVEVSDAAEQPEPGKDYPPHRQAA